MSDYKLAPMEPTLEMMEAGAEGCGQDLDRDEARGRAFVAYKAMIAAAPAVQAEPVGWVWHSYNQTNFTSGSHHKEVLEADGVKLTPVYTAPQPAVQGEPVAWIRKWSLDGEKPTKERNKNGRMAYPMKYKLHEVTRNRCLPDDVALYAAPQPAEQQPAEQKPVAWIIRHPRFCGKFTDDKETAEYWESKEQGCTAPLYAAPKPTEQQPPADGSLTPVPDELFAAEFNAWWEQHGQFCRAGGGDYERTFAFEAWRHLYPKLMKLQKVAAEQQPAPDVTQLVEALELIAESRDVGRHDGLPEEGPALCAAESWLIAKGALAAYRKQGGRP